MTDSLAQRLLALGDEFDEIKDGINALSCLSSEIDYRSADVMSVSFMGDCLYDKAKAFAEKLQAMRTARPMAQPASAGGKLNLRPLDTDPATGEKLIEKLFKERATHRRAKRKFDDDKELDRWTEEHDELEEKIFKADACSLEDIAIKLDVLVDRLLGETGPRGHCFDYIGAASARDDLRRLIAAQGE